jgi:DNA polymerase (family 10)
MSKGERILMIQAKDLATDCAYQLAAAGVKHQICGSIRREVKATVGDFDIVVDRLLRAYTALGGTAAIKRPPGKIPRQVDVMYQGLNVNLYMAFDDEWGAMVLFLTGNGQFNIQLRALAKRQGLKLNQYGLWEGANKLAGRTEEQIFHALGLRMVEPWEREFKPGVWAIDNFKEI